MKSRTLQHNFETLPLTVGDRLIYPTSSGWGEVVDFSGDTITVYWFTGLTHRLTLEQFHKAGFIRQDGTPLIQPQSKPETPNITSGNPHNKVSRTNSGSRIERKTFRRGDKVYGPYEYLRYESGGKSRSVYLGKAPAISPQASSPATFDRLKLG